MEIQLQELIEQIKKDGVAEAQAKAQAIIEAANAEAQKIISDAKEKAQKLLSDAKEENERMVKASDEAIRQAGRNVLISFRESVGNELRAVIGEGVTNVYSSKELSQLIVKVVEAWTSNTGTEDIAVLLNSGDLEKLEASLMASLKERMLGGVTLRANDSFDGGFRIAVNNGKAYYDYSAEAVVQMLSAYLSPKVTALLKEAKDT